MKWSLDELSDYEDNPLSVDATLDLKADLMSRYAKQILDVDPIKTHAYVLYDHGNAVLNAHVKGKIVVPSSRSLLAVELPLDFSFSEVYVPTEKALKAFEEKDQDDVAILIDDGYINFDKAVGDNIITQIPMHILSKEELAGESMPKGQDWQVVSEDDYLHPKADSNKVDPRFAKLKDFFKDSDE